jgi:hypothetical protein
MAKKDYNAINFKNKDIDKFSSKFGNGDPIKKTNITSVSESTSVNTPNFKAVVTKNTPLNSGVSDKDRQVRDNIIAANKKNASPENKAALKNNNAYIQSKITQEKQDRKDLMTAKKKS